MFVFRLERRPMRSWEEPHSVVEPVIVLGGNTCGHLFKVTQRVRDCGTILESPTVLIF